MFMRKQTITLSFFALVFFLITSCGKDKDFTPTKTKTELICSGTWKFDKATASGVGDISSQPALACYVDNTMTFSSNLTGTISEGANVCTTPAPANFTWSFLSSETILRLSFTLFTGGSPDFTIVSLSETSMVLSQTMTIAPYPATTIEVTFKH